MAHPYKDQANSTHKAKTGSMGKINNLDIPIMRAVGENKPGKPYVSSTSMQHKAQSGADGMKRGGHVGKPKHSKPPVIIPPPPPPDPTAMAGAMPPAGPPMMPPGAGGTPPMKSGGKVVGPYKWQKGGGGSGVGRLEEAKHAAFKPIKGRKGYADGGEVNSPPRADIHDMVNRGSIRGSFGTKDKG